VYDLKTKNSKKLIYQTVMIVQQPNIKSRTKQSKQRFASLLQIAFLCLSFSHFKKKKKEREREREKTVYVSLQRHLSSYRETQTLDTLKALSGCKYMSYMTIMPLSPNSSQSPTVF